MKVIFMECVICFVLELAVYHLAQMLVILL